MNLKSMSEVYREEVHRSRMMFDDFRSHMDKMAKKVLGDSDLTWNGKLMAVRDLVKEDPIYEWFPAQLVADQFHKAVMRVMKRKQRARVAWNNRETAQYVRRNVRNRGQGISMPKRLTDEQIEGINALRSMDLDGHTVEPIAVSPDQDEELKDLQKAVGIRKEER